MVLVVVKYFQFLDVIHESYLLSSHFDNLVPLLSDGGVIDSDFLMDPPINAFKLHSLNLFSFFHFTLKLLDVKHPI